MVFRIQSFTGLNVLLETYQIQAKTEGKSPKTIRIYTTAIMIFIKFLERQGFATDVAGIGTEEIREFIRYLQNVKAFMNHPFTGPQNKGLTGHTINCYLRALRAFWSWLIYEEYIDINPFDKIKVPKPPKKVIMPFSQEQISALLGSIDTKSATGFRDWALTLTLLDTGIRVSELTELNLEDTDLVRRCLKIHGKGNKERMVPIGITVQRALGKYINKYRPKPAYPLSEICF